MIEMKETEVSFFAAVSRDRKTAYESSSGGIFYELCRTVIDSGGVVYGAVQETPKIVCHKKAVSLDEVRKLRKSKYARSRLDDIFSDAKDELDKGVTVLFSGTPCQIAGLKNYLGCEYDNLLTVEVVCHGVPLSKAYEKYIEEKETIHNSSMKDIVFRDKRYGWKKNVIVEYYENGDEEECQSTEHRHHGLYIKGINMNEGCSRCPFARLPRKGDIALADFWNYRGKYERMFCKTGISLVVINSDKGRKAFGTIKDNIYFDEVSRDMASQSCRHLENAPYIHHNQRTFEMLLDHTSFGTAAILCSGYGDVVMSSELRTFDKADSDEILQVFLEDTYEIVYIIDGGGRIKGIVTFGDFARKYPFGEEWINHGFSSISIDKADCVQKLDDIFRSNEKINRIPVTDADGKLIAEVRRHPGSTGKEDPRRFIVPFLKIKKEKLKCYYYKRPSYLEDYAFSEEQRQRIKFHRDFSVLEKEEGQSELKMIIGEKYTPEYVCGLKNISSIIRKGRRYQHADIISEYVNVIRGMRRVCFQPDDYRITVHIYGRCGVFGYAVEDVDTIPSQIQRRVSDMNVRVLNHSTHGAEDEQIIQNLLEDLREGRIEDQDMIVLYMNDLPVMQWILELGAYYCDTTEGFYKALEDPERNIDFYDIPGHMNAGGYNYIAEFIAGDMQADLRVQLSRSEQIKRRREKQVHGLLLERSQEKELEEFVDEVRRILPADFMKKSVGAVLMNCDPFTKGHRYLIETALKSVDILLAFVVEEDMANFSFEDRISMVRKGTEDLKDVYVFRSGHYMSSVFTLPDYFFRGQQKNAIIDNSFDIEIFAGYIAPRLNISKRFVGTETVDEVTYIYNEEMKKILPEYSIELVEIERLKIHENNISAKTARKLIDEWKEDELRDLLPESSVDYLRGKKNRV